MQLIVAFWYAVVADETGRVWVARAVDRCAVHSQKTIIPEQFTVVADGVKLVEYFLKHVGRDSCAALRNGGGRGVNADTVQFLCQRAAVCANQQRDNFFNRQFAET